MRALRRPAHLALAVVILAAAACGSSDRDDDGAATDPTGESTTSAAAAADPTTTVAGPTGDDAGDGGASTTTAAPTDPEAELFGDLAWPCGPAAEPNTDDGSETGVTADSVSIASGDDAGLEASPGLFHEMTDAMNAFVDRCNELGGIHGRQIDLRYYDAAVFEIATAIQSACDEGNFFLVGEGWAFDVSQEEIRLNCGLPAVPGISTAAAFANGPLMYQPLPNPADEMSAGSLANLATLFPEEVTTAGTLASNFPAATDSRDRVVEAGPLYGWDFVSTDIVYNPAGEADWTPFVRQLQDAGATVVRFAGDCLALQQFAQAAAANSYDVVISTDTNAYAETCAQLNADGGLDTTHISMAFVPFEDAASNPATQQYLDLIEASGGDPAVLGMQAASAFLLWASAAADCGTQLTRQCVLDNLAEVHEWTGGGLHAPTDPGGNHPTACDITVRFDGTGYVRVLPEEPATFVCSDDFVAPITATPALLAARLDDNRIAQQFTGG